jgi:hypothetical protein
MLDPCQTSITSSKYHQMIFPIYSSETSSHLHHGKFLKIFSTTNSIAVEFPIFHVQHLFSPVKVAPEKK